jgi:hypothetical protein
MVRIVDAVARAVALATITMFLINPPDTAGIAVAVFSVCLLATSWLGWKTRR